ncbi:MAG TPA: orotate phosphoribosyltransferase [Methanosarcinales archaeon]|nr:orotate phosphoribosyltransferase [Methanosarcinales archaeon]
MELKGICNICGNVSTVQTCHLCGMLVCEKCFDIYKGVCVQCSRGKFLK